MRSPSLSRCIVESNSPINSFAVQMIRIERYTTLALDIMRKWELISTTYFINSRRHQFPIHNFIRFALHRPRLSCSVRTSLLDDREKKKTTFSPAYYIFKPILSISLYAFRVQCSHSLGRIKKKKKTREMVDFSWRRLVVDDVVEQCSCARKKNNKMFNV